jgi:hypothetical protein
MTSNQRFAVLSALIDREPVDPDLLAEALDDPAGRAELVDFVRLRVRVADELGDDAFGVPPSAPRPSAVKRWLLRAAFVLLPLGCGAAGGAWFMAYSESRPPTPTRVMQFVAGVDWK